MLLGPVCIHIQVGYTCLFTGRLILPCTIKFDAKISKFPKLLNPCCAERGSRDFYRHLKLSRDAMKKDYASNAFSGVRCHFFQDVNE